MVIDIIVGVFAGLIVVGLLFYFIWSSKKNKGCNCSKAKALKKDIEKARKEIEKEKK